MLAALPYFRGVSVLVMFSVRQNPCSTWQEGTSALRKKRARAGGLANG